MNARLLSALLAAICCAGGREAAMADGDAAPVPEFPWAQYGLTPSTSPACIPTARTDWAVSYHEAMLKREPREGVKLVFLGDSITMMWRTQSGYEGGTPVWDQHYAALPAANFGISGDRTEQLLWRITEGRDLDGLSPKVLILLVGINNLLQRQDTPAQVAEGTASIVGFLRRQLPETRILLLGIFPCWERPEDPARAWVKQTNALTKPLADGKRVWFLDIGGKFLEPDGTIRKEKLRDMLHPSEIGYRIWADAMAPYLKDLLEGDGQGDVWK